MIQFLQDGDLLMQRLYFLLGKLWLCYHFYRHFCRDISLELSLEDLAEAATAQDLLVYVIQLL